MARCECLRCALCSPSQGLDIDYESSNVIPNFVAFARAMKAAFAAEYTLSVSAASARHLLDARPYIASWHPTRTSRHFASCTRSLCAVRLRHSPTRPQDQVFMQSYEGGHGIPVEFFLGAGYESSSIFYGLCPETNCYPAPTLASALEVVCTHQLGGTHLWRLNSDNYLVEGAMQAKAHPALHAMR